MPVRLHRGEPAPPPATPVTAPAAASAPSVTPRLGTPRPGPAFPAPPTVRLAPPVPLRLSRTRERLLTGAAAALGGAAVVWAALAGARAALRYHANLDGIVVVRTRALTAPAAGRVHLLAAPGARVDTGAALAEILPPAPAVPAPTPSPEARRLEESLRRAELALAAARKHQTEVDALLKEERATKSEHDDASRDVRFRLAERDRLATALAAASAVPSLAAPAPIPLVADIPVVIDAFSSTDGAEINAGDPLATVHPGAVWVEAALGRTHAPDEGAPVTVRLEGKDIPGRIAGIHVEGSTRTVTVAFDSATPLPAGTHVAIFVHGLGS